MLLFLLLFGATLRASEEEIDAGTGRIHASFNLARLGSPILVWNSLIKLTDEYGEIIKTEGYTPQNEARLEHLEGQMMKLFDMREVPPSLKNTRAVEASVVLREVISRFNPLEEGVLPDRKQAIEEMNSGYPPLWSVHDTDVIVIYVDSGMFDGSFQFSHRTLELTDELYELTRHLEYQDKDVEGLYDAYFLTPGPLIPSSWIRALPEWTHHDLWGQGIWQWMALLVGFIVLWVILAAAVTFILRISSDWSPVMRGGTRLFLPLIVYSTMSTFVDYLDYQVFITGKVLTTLRYLDETTELICWISVVFILGNTICRIIARRSAANATIDTQLLLFAIRICTVLVAMIVVIQGLARIGVPLATVLTGAGVTGLALALAAQESLRNIFGSMMLLLDKPFKVGQRVKVRGHDGIIQEIGLRSTKIRTLTGHLASIPNEDVAKADIENIGERPYIRRVFNLTITRDTSPEKVDEAMQIVRDLLSMKEGEERNRNINYPDFAPRVAFNELNSDSLNLLVIYWFHPPAYWDYLDHATWVNRELIRRFGEAGIEFAYPTQTLRLANDAKRPEFLGGEPEKKANGDMDK
ncbi:MAG: mechanosensitive ion channel family protein [Puniceicoccales bacterium]